MLNMTPIQTDGDRMNIPNNPYAGLMEYALGLDNAVKAHKGAGSRAYMTLSDNPYISRIRETELSKSSFSGVSSIDLLLRDAPTKFPPMGRHNYLGNTLPANSISLGNKDAVYSTGMSDKYSRPTLDLMLNYSPKQSNYRLH